MQNEENEDAAVQFAMVHSAWNKYRIGIGRRYFRHDPLIQRMCHFLEKNPAQL